MKQLRTGSHWGLTIVDSDMSEDPDEEGRRPSDRLVGMVRYEGDAREIVLAVNEKRRRDE